MLARTLNLDKTQPSIFRFRLALIQEYRRGLEEGLDLGVALKIPSVSSCLCVGLGL